MRRRNPVAAIYVVTLVCILAAGFLFGGFAQAGTLTATYSPTFPPATLVSFDFAGASNPITIPMLQGSGTRLGGTDLLVPSLPSPFYVYCVEVGQTIDAFQIVTHNDVVPLLGSTTDPLGNPLGVPVFFGAARTLLLMRLWGAYQTAVTDTALAASFQLAVYELAFDTGADLLSGALTSVDPAAVQAQTWLTSVASGAILNTQPLLLITDPDLQDLITPSQDPSFNTPEPSSLMLLSMAALGMMGIGWSRRRKR